VQWLIFLLEGEFLVSAQGIGEIARLGVGEIVGEMSLLDSAPPSATVVANGDCMALFLDKDVLLQRLETDAAFGARFYKALAVFLADRLRGTVRRLGYGDTQPFDPGTIAKDELDVGILDGVSVAGDRFDRMLKMLAGVR
jgi:CRP/FNR family transcriptional regulator, cyclic AMP receptor protein